MDVAEQFLDACDALDREQPFTGWDADDDNTKGWKGVVHVRPYTRRDGTRVDGYSYERTDATASGGLQALTGQIDNAPLEDAWGAGLISLRRRYAKPGQDLGYVVPDVADAQDAKQQVMVDLAARLKDDDAFRKTMDDFGFRPGSSNVQAKRGGTEAIDASTAERMKEITPIDPPEAGLSVRNAATRLRMTERNLHEQRAKLQIEQLAAIERGESSTVNDYLDQRIALGDKIAAARSLLDELEARTARESFVESLVAAWAGTAADNDRLSLGIQAAASAEFGADLGHLDEKFKGSPKWHRLPPGLAARWRKLGQIYGGGEKIDTFASTDMWASLYYADIVNAGVDRGEYDQLVSDTALAERKLPPERRPADPGLRSFVRAEYENTQQWLKDNKIDQVKLYRGMAFPKPGDSPPEALLQEARDLGYGLHEAGTMTDLIEWTRPGIEAWERALKLREAEQARTRAISDPNSPDGRQSNMIRAIAVREARETLSRHKKLLTALELWTPDPGTADQNPFPSGVSQQPVQLQPLSSFAHTYDAANQFSQGITGDGNGDNAAIVSAVVPRERIFATPFTGIGSLSENEVVVLGGKDDKASVWAWRHGGPRPANDTEFDGRMMAAAGSFPTIAEIHKMTDRAALTRLLNLVEQVRIGADDETLAGTSGLWQAAYDQLRSLKP